MPPTVLVVEDEPDILDFVTQALEAEGYTVEGFTEGQAALDFVTQRIPDIALVDLLMPGIAGDEFILAARSLPRGSYPIIVMSASTDTNRIWSVPIQDYLPKPFDIDELLARIERLLRPARWRGTNQHDSHEAG
jgi:two-component system phosphate regulon response regulator PhoB